jgi:hypothetical protein
VPAPIVWADVIVVSGIKSEVSFSQAPPPSDGA